MQLLVKLLVQRLFSFTPLSLRFRLNELIVVLFRRDKSKVSDRFLRKELIRSSKVAADLRRLGDSKTIDWKILELGTGWHGSDLIVFYLTGCPHVSSIDVYPFLKDSIFSVYLNETKSHLGLISEISGVDLKFIAANYSAISDCESFSQFSDVTGYKYYAPMEVTKFVTDLKFDLFYSYSVLHRLSNLDLKRILSTVSSVMKPGFFSYHVVHHYDFHARIIKGLSPLYYLHFKEPVWEILQSRYLNYQNRLRSVEFVKIFEEHQHSIVVLETTSLDDILYIPAQLSERFSLLSKAEVLVARSTFFLKSKK